MKKSNLLNRRTFINKTAIASGALLLSNEMIPNTLFSNKDTSINNLELHLFSKCLQFLNYEETCEAAKEMGFSGLDLTVRPKGHVLPENVLEDLPKVTKMMETYRLTPKMISSSIISATDLTNITVLETAKKLGYEVYRTGWLKYDKKYAVQENVTKAKNQLTQLAALNKKIGISGGYQNHKGHYIGSAIWDLNQILSGISPVNLGSQYDIMHANVEGGQNWEIGFKLIKPNINSIVLKDYKWEKINNQWKVVYTPLGEGMIDFHYYLSLLKKHNIQVPISLHAEYDLGGAEKGRKSIISKSEILKRIKKDVDYIQQVWQEVN